MTPAEAKTWLIREIISEAESQRLSLDSLEARMLEYSETARTPPDLEELNAAFDQTHDEAEYENKIAALIRGMLTRWRIENNPKLMHWRDATIALSREDHYLLVLISTADRTQTSAAGRPRKRSLLRLFLIAVIATIAMTLLLGYLATHTR